MLRTASVFGVLALASSAFGVIIQPSSIPARQTGLTMVVDERGSTGAGDVVSRRYDNWTNPPSLLNALFTTGGQEIADDLTFIPGGSLSRLSNLGFAVANSNGVAGSSFTGGQVVIRFYDVDTGLPILSVDGFNGFTANLPALALAPGGSSRISFGAFGTTGLEGLNTYFLGRTGVFASLQFNSVTGTGGFTIANAGMQLRGPIAVGSSTDVMFGIGAGPMPTGAFNFGGTPLANSAWFIDTNDVPAPGSFALLGLGGLFAARRRRA